MLTKLTLTIDQSVVAQAKQYARKKNSSVSRIVEEYLKNIAMPQGSTTNIGSIKSPITDSISGMFHDTGASYQEMIDEALREKYL
jgi:hypothetical protein